MVKKKESMERWCCWGYGRRGFPTFAVIVFVLAVFWLLSEIGVITTGVPWLPVILVVISLGCIIDHYAKR